MSAYCLSFHAKSAALSSTDQESSLNIVLIRGLTEPSQNLCPVFGFSTLLKSVKYSKSVDRLEACFGRELVKTLVGFLHPLLLVNPHQGEAERSAEQEGDKEKVSMRRIQGL